VLPFERATFDMVFCQQGLQFFPDKPGALREMRRVLVSGGKLVLGVWCSVEQQPGGRAMAEALERHVSPEAGVIRRSPFSFGDPDALEALAADAGFQDIVVKPTVMTVRFPSAEAFTKRYISARVPLNQMVAAVDEKARDAIVADVNFALAHYEAGTGLELPTAVNVVTANA
jgi:SAM-dependent methyltransferase